MKKILFIIEGADQSYIDGRAKEMTNQEGIILVNGKDMKIFQIDGGEIKRVYPEILKEKTKIGELEISTERPENSEEEMLKNSVQKIKPIKIDPEVLRRSKNPPGKRFRRTKKEMKDTKVVKKKAKKYPDSMKEFIEKHMNQNSNEQLSKLINEKWDADITPIRLNSYMTYYKIRRSNPSEFRDYTKTKKLKKVGKPTKYTDEVVQFLKENVNNFSNKELCEELEHRFNIKIKSDPMSNLLCQKGIKRDNQPDMDKEIVDFILKSKINDVYYLRDKIIEKFEKDIQTAKLRNVMSQRTKELPGESATDEIKRIKQQREKDGDDFLDELELD